LDFKVRAANAPQSIDDLLARLARVRRTGWCEAMDEAVPGVGSLSVAVEDPLTQSLALCVSFPAHLVSKAERLKLANTLLRAAQQVQLDGRSHDPSEKKRRAIAG
jgi:DNA-binding IclR family transcriptional regulator